MLYREIIVVCSEFHTKHINTLCGQNVELECVQNGGISNHWATRGNHEHKEDTCQHVGWCLYVGQHTDCRPKVCDCCIRLLHIPDDQTNHLIYGLFNDAVRISECRVEW